MDAYTVTAIVRLLQKHQETLQQISFSGSTFGYTQDAAEHVLMRQLADALAALPHLKAIVATSSGDMAQVALWTAEASLTLEWIDISGHAIDSKPVKNLPTVIEQLATVIKLGRLRGVVLSESELPGRHGTCLDLPVLEETIDVLREAILAPTSQLHTMCITYCNDSVRWGLEDVDDGTYETSLDDYRMMLLYQKISSALREARSRMNLTAVELPLDPIHIFATKAEEDAAIQQARKIYEDNQGGQDEDDSGSEEEEEEAEDDSGSDEAAESRAGMVELEAEEVKCDAEQSSSSDDDYA